VAYAIRRQIFVALRGEEKSLKCLRSTSLNRAQFAGMPDEKKRENYFECSFHIQCFTVIIAFHFSVEWL
jgi:hypothetical protein